MSTIERLIQEIEQLDHFVQAGFQALFANPKQ